MHLPSHIANLNVLAGTPAPSPFRTLYPSAHPTTLVSTDDDTNVHPTGAGAGVGAGVGSGMEDPLLEESLKRHLDLWINTEFSWTEDGQAGAFGGEDSPRDKEVEGGVDSQTTTTHPVTVEKDEDGEMEMDLMDYYKTRVKQGKEKNVLLDQRLGRDDDLHTGKEVRGQVDGETVRTAVVEGKDESLVAPAPTAPGSTTQAPDLASFLNQYSALLSSTLPSFDSLDPVSGRSARPTQTGQKADEGKVVVEVDNDKTEGKREKIDRTTLDTSSSQSHSETLESNKTTHVPSSGPRTRLPPPTPRAQQHLYPSAPAPTPAPTTDVQTDNDDKLPGQEQNLMALLAAAFPQYASTFEAPAPQQQQRHSNAGMNNNSDTYLLSGHASANAHSARAPQDSTTGTTANPATNHSTPFVYAPHHPAFNQHQHGGMDYTAAHQQHQQLSGEIDRVFGTVDLGEGLYHQHHQHHDGAAQKTIDILPRRTGSASAGSLTDASLNSFDLGTSAQQNLVQQQLAVMSSSSSSSPSSPPQGKKRRVSDDSSVPSNVNVVRAFEPRFTQASLASLTVQALGQAHGYPQESTHGLTQSQGQSRKRSLDSMDPDQHDGGVLPDGVTPEEE